LQANKWNGPRPAEEKKAQVAQEKTGGKRGGERGVKNVQLAKTGVKGGAWEKVLKERKRGSVTERFELI